MEINIVENGYKIPFKKEPEQIYINKYFETSEITNLLNKGCIKEVSTKPLIRLR